MITLQELLDSGVHFGHRVSRWNPKMEKYIHGKRSLIHIINLRETIRGLIRSANLLRKIAAEGRPILFVGTKRQARNLIKTEANRCGMHYVNERWLGGTLTNYATIRERLSRLLDLEALETDGRIELYSKKEISQLSREKRRIKRNLEGIRNMEKLPGALVVVDNKREENAVREARRLGIPVICIIDTDCDPDLADIVIPGNDDAFRSIKTLLSRLTDAVIEGKKAYSDKAVIEEKKRLEEKAKQDKEKKDREKAYRKIQEDRKPVTAADGKHQASTEIDSAEEEVKTASHLDKQADRTEEN